MSAETQPTDGGQPYNQNRVGWYSWLTVDTVLDWLAENSQDPEKFATIRNSLAERLASKPEKIERSS